MNTVTPTNSALVYISLECNPNPVGLCMARLSISKLSGFADVYDHRWDSPAEFISSWSTCWHWVRDVGVEFEVLALDDNRPPSSYPHVRRVDIGSEVGHVDVEVEAWVSRCRGWFQDVSTSFEMLVLGLSVPIGWFRDVVAGWFRDVGTGFGLILGC